jgi:hypothetical protein
VNDLARMRMKNHGAVVHYVIVVTRNAILGRHLSRSVRSVTKTSANREFFFVNIRTRSFSHDILPEWLALFDGYPACNCCAYDSTSYCRSDSIVRASSGRREEHRSRGSNTHYL